MVYWNYLATHASNEIDIPDICCVVLYRPPTPLMSRLLDFIINVLHLINVSD